MKGADFCHRPGNTVGGMSSDTPGRCNAAVEAPPRIAYYAPRNRRECAQALLIVEKG
jgi:hypothetical protein